MLAKIREYREAYKPTFWLFEGQGKGKNIRKPVYRKYSSSLKEVRIDKPATQHWLRHSFATHCWRVY